MFKDIVNSFVFDIKWKPTRDLFQPSEITSLEWYIWSFVYSSKAC